MKLKKRLNIKIVIAFAIGLILGIFLAKGSEVRRIFQSIVARSQASFLGQTTEISEWIVPQEHQGKLQLFILAGQSNMSGMGDVPKSGVRTNPRIYVFGNDYHWKLAREPVDNPINQVDVVSEDKSAGFSPAMSFATALLEKHPNMAIGLIPCAKGGSSIYEWRRDLNDNMLYGSCLKRVRAASVMGEVAGVLYFQGEIDAVDPKEHPNRTLLPDRWADEFAVLIGDWRRDLNLPQLPVVFAQIGTNTQPERFKNWEIVKQQQRKVQLPFSAMVTTEDLPLKDYVHFTTESYQTIGQRFAEAYIKLLQ
jgi:hypothetical protein